MLAIKNNLMAANAARQLGINYDALATSVERLSSGLRINSAKDDAAGLAVRELMRADIAVIDQGSRNAMDGISMLQTMEGAMQTINDALVRMNQLAEQATTGSYSDAQRIIMNAEFAEMAEEIERIATGSKFNDITMLDNTTDVDIQFGSSSDVVTVSGADMTKSGLGITTGSAGYKAVSDTGVANAASDTWTTVTGDEAGDKVTIEITFDTDSVAEDKITIELVGGAAPVNYTLQQVVDLINAESQNLGNDENGVSKNYAMASAVKGDDLYGRDPLKYYLQVDSRLATADGLTMEGKVGDDGTETVDGGFDACSAKSTLFDLTEAYIADDGDSGKMGYAAGTGINILSPAAANLAMTAVTAAINAKDTARAAFGYKMNRLESTISVLNIQSENLLAAESRISDVDVATEMAALTRFQVLSQAGVSMLAQANMMPQMALTLLR